MNAQINRCLVFVVSGLLVGCSSAKNPLESTNLAGRNANRDFTKDISDILTECQKIKPGMTRLDLLKVFTPEGGISTAAHGSFFYRGCPYIKVDVDFILSDPTQKMVDERPTDKISRISKPYLDWSIID